MWQRKEVERGRLVEEARAGNVGEEEQNGWRAGVRKDCLRGDEVLRIAKET
jgi:hypothetical protein